MCVCTSVTAACSWFCKSSQQTKSSFVILNNKRGFSLLKRNSQLIFWYSIVEVYSPRHTCLFVSSPVQELCGQTLTDVFRDIKQYTENLSTMNTSGLLIMLISGWPCYLLLIKGGPEHCPVERRCRQLISNLQNLTESLLYTENLHYLL